MLKPPCIFTIFAIGMLLAAALQPAIANPLQDVIATPETISVSDEYGAIMAAVNAAQAGDIDPSLDSDGDGISDYDEINGFTWGDKTYFTNPYMASTDRDPYDDYMEITGINMPTAVTWPGRHPCVPSDPNFQIELEEIDYVTMCEITSSKSITKGTQTTIGVEVSQALTLSPLKWGETTVKTSWSTSWLSRTEWSEATAVDPSEAAKLKFRMRVRNKGTDAAKNVKLRFNVLIGEEDISNTIWTDVVQWRIEPGESSDEMVISKDKDGNDIIVSLDELKSIECGTPLTIKVTEINAEVPWEDGWITWDDHVGEIEPVSSTILFDSGDGEVRTYYVWSGLHLIGSAPHPYIHNITLWEAIDRTLGVEDREDGLYISGKKYEEGWSFLFNNKAYNEVNKTLSDLPDPSIYDLLNITIAQGWEVAIKTSPDTEPPVISWASYSKDMKTITASVSDNLFLHNVSAHVKYGSNYTDIPLKDEDGDQVFTATLPEKIIDTYDDYVTATDGTFVAIRNDIRITPFWWPMFHHDTSHTGSSLSDAPDDNNVLWEFKTGDSVYSSPAVADGKVFVGSHDNHIYCLDMNTGEENWKFKTGDSVYSSPAVADGKVFVGSYDNHIYCLDMNTGDKKWKFKTGDSVYSSPAVADGKVFVGSDNGFIYCFGSELSPPTATIESISPNIAVQGEDTISFEGNGTDNGIVVAYQWESTIDGVINTSESFSIAASDLSLGTHSIFFKVQDDEGLWSTQDVGYVTVTSPNAPPVVVFTISPDYPVINEAITFNASDSYDPGDGLDQFIKKYNWDFGDGATATGKVVTHAYPEVGNYNVTLNVTDYYGLTNETTKTVSVYRDHVYTNEVGVTSTITVDSPSTLAAFLPDEYNDTDISHAIVLNVNVTDSTPGNGTDDAYVDITMNVGDMDVETCQVFKVGSGFLSEVDDVTALPTVSGNASFSRNMANETVTVRLYAGDPLLGVVPPEEKEPTPTPPPTVTPPPRGGGGGGGAPRDSDGDGYDDIQELIAGTDPNDPNDYPGKPTVTPTPTPTPPPLPTPTPEVIPAATPAVTPTPTPTPPFPPLMLPPLHVVMVIVIGLVAAMLIIAGVYRMLRRRL